jgi:hypothetical protein
MLDLRINNRVWRILLRCPGVLSLLIITYSVAAFEIDGPGDYIGSPLIGEIQKYPDQVTKSHFYLRRARIFGWVSIASSLPAAILIAVRQSNARSQRFQIIGSVFLLLIAWGSFSVWHRLCSQACEAYPASPQL